MKKASIALDVPEQGLRPFGVLSGLVGWAEGVPTEGLELRLFWSTRGRGTEEAGVVEVRPVVAAGQREFAFRFDLPRKPYSFSGRLISVVWALELVDGEGAGLALEEFVLSPTGKEIVLGEVQKPRSEGRKGRWKSK